MNWPTAASVRGVRWTTKGPGDFDPPEDDPRLAQEIESAIEYRAENSSLRSVLKLAEKDGEIEDALRDIVYRHLHRNTPLKRAMLDSKALRDEVTDDIVNPPYDPD